MACSFSSEDLSSGRVCSPHCFIGLGDSLLDCTENDCMKWALSAIFLVMSFTYLPLAAQESAPVPAAAARESGQENPHLFNPVGDSGEIFDAGEEHDAHRHPGRSRGSLYPYP